MKLLIITLIVNAGICLGQFDWPEDGAAIRQGLHIEWQRTGDANSDGSMIFAWSDCRNGIRDVIAQKIDINGNNLWGENGVVVVNAEGRQEDPQLVSDGNGGAFVIWADYRDESDTYGDIYAQHLNSNGELSWGEEGAVLANQPNKQGSLNICKDGIGGAYVIWKDKNASSYADIYGTHLTVDGPVGQGMGFPLVTHPSNRSYPSLESAGGGDAVLTWSIGVEEADLYAQRIRFEDDIVTTLWSDPEEGGIVICNAQFAQASPRVHHFSDMETIITWEDKRKKEEYGGDQTSEIADIYFQIFDEGGENLLEENGRPACEGNWKKIKPRVKAENSVAYLVWEDSRNGNKSDIFAQKLNFEGENLWDNGREISTAEESQSQPRLTSDGAGGIYFTWEDHRNSDNTDIDIYFQHVNSSDNNSFIEDGLLICEAPFMQFNPLVRNDGVGGAFIIWGDLRTEGSIGMFTQHIDQAGITLEVNGLNSFFGIATDAANDSYYQGVINMGNDNGIVYWQDNRWGNPVVYGQKINSGFDFSSDYFSNQSINGKPLSYCPLKQVYPKMIKAGENLFLSFISEETPNSNLYYQVLDSDLNIIGDSTGTAISTPETSKQGFDMVYAEDGYIYYAYSEEYDLYVQKLDIFGNPVWQTPLLAVSNMLLDDNIKAVYPYPGGGCIIIYESSSSIIGSFLIYGLAIDGNGEIMENWTSAGVQLSDITGLQEYDSSILTNNGVLTIFTENSMGNINLYAQLISYNGELLMGVTGLQLAAGPYDEKSAALAYNTETNDVFACWENPRLSNVFVDTELDIYCTNINLTDQSIGTILELSNIDYDQMNPNIQYTGESYIIAWEDYRNSTITHPETDVFFQEINAADLSLQFENGGIPVCEAPLKQINPRIAKYSDSSDSYVIVWEDYRSTGKEFCANLFAQSITYGEVSINPSILVNDFAISRIYPNPFNPVITIDFIVPRQSMVDVGIYNLRGQLVETLLSGRMNPGSHVLQWNAENFSSGVYMVNYSSPTATISEKIILIK